MDPADPDRHWYVTVTTPGAANGDTDTHGPFDNLKEAKDWIQARQKTPRTLTVTKPEFDTILAALRFWQERRNDGLDCEDLHDIATDGDLHEPLNEAEIDELCERLNISFLTAEAKPTVEVTVEGGVVQDVVVPPGVKVVVRDYDCDDNDAAELDDNGDAYLEAVYG